MCVGAINLDQDTQPTWDDQTERCRSDPVNRRWMRNANMGDGSFARARAGERCIFYKSSNLLKIIRQGDGVKHQHEDAYQSNGAVKYLLPTAWRKEGSAPIHDPKRRAGQRQQQPNEIE